MKLYLDPHKDGCTVWFVSGNVQYLKGNIDEVCHKLKEYVIYEETDDIGNYTKTQSARIYLDCTEIGMSYMQWFKNNGVKIHKCTHKTLIK